MYSDDDTQDMECGEDDFYTDDDYNDGVDDHEGPDHDYAVLNEEDIRRKQKEDIEQVSKVLSISEVVASILLLHYRWNVSKVNDEWFADEERVRRTVGILEGPVVITTPHGGKKFTCGICFDSLRPKKIVPIACSHPFCNTCWTSYISTSINDGPGCLMLKCPDPSCHVAVGGDMIEKLACKKDKDKYNGYFLRSYVEDNRKVKWCPAPGCERAIEFSAAGGGSSDVYCSCSHSFCWGCNEDAHRPVDCDTVAQWIRKNSSESENTKWILANSKACPKCRRQIEKNHGCMHMTCTAPCRHQFCWLCLGAWSAHGERSGGYYACNRYEADKREGLYDEAEKRREMAKKSIERYTHYYERWASNQTSRQKAMEALQILQSEKLKKLCEIQRTTEIQLKFIIDAWLQIIECRRVLKWTYAYGYYLPKTDHDKRRFFEYLQGEADSGLERLHKCAEKELEVFENAKGPSKDFDEFRVKLTGFTNATKTYFENLVKALENGLTDVDSQAASSKSTNLDSQPASGKSRNYIDMLFERPMSDEDIFILSQALDEDYSSN